MTRKAIMTVLLCTCLVSSAVASTNTKPAATKKPSATPANSAAPKSAADVRTLDAIRIEGEIDVPQVLFITARDYRRFRDATPAPYTITSAAVAKSVPLPDRLRLVAPAK